MCATTIWDQRKTLAPPPFRGEMATLLPGLHVGDEPVDRLPDNLVSPCLRARANADASTLGDGIAQLPEPDWLDMSLVIRGQQCWGRGNK